MAGFFGHGAQLLFNSIPVAGCLDLPTPEQAREEVEITDMNSNFFREFVPGLIDNGTLDITLRWVPGDVGQQELKDSLGSTVAVPVEILGPTHMTPRERISFDGFTQSLGGTFFWENTAAEIALTLRVTGPVTFGVIP